MKQMLKELRYYVLLSFFLSGVCVAFGQEDASSVVNDSKRGADVMGQSESEKPKLHDVSLIYGIGPYTGRDWMGGRYMGNGMLSVQYVLNASEVLGIGAVLGYDHYTEKHSDYTSDDFMAMFIVRATWLNRPKFTLYSKAGLGYCWMGKKGGDGYTAYILPLPSIGATFSLGKNFYALTEFSLLSTQGLLLFGAGYRF